MSEALPIILSVCSIITWEQSWNLQLTEFVHFFLLWFHQFLVKVYTILNLSYVDDTTLMAENEEELKSLLMRVKEDSEKAGLNSI